VGVWELALVFVVGLIVLGPERLPVAIRTVSRWVNTIKSAANSVKAEVNEELRIHELHSNLKKAEQKGMEDLAPSIKESVDELKKAADSVQNSYVHSAQHDADNKKNNNPK